MPGTQEILLTIKRHPFEHCPAKPVHLVSERQVEKARCTGLCLNVQLCKVRAEAHVRVECQHSSLAELASATVGGLSLILPACNYEMSFSCSFYI